MRNLAFRFNNFWMGKRSFVHTAEKGYRSVRRTIVQIWLNVDLRKSLRHTRLSDYRAIILKDVWNVSLVQVFFSWAFKKNRDSDPFSANASEQKRTVRHFNTKINNLWTDMFYLIEKFYNIAEMEIILIF